ncbi:DUF2158 domain-containing protein [Massilia antarctica]|uniref:DUF2158 domain-containing protein n=1 Tax=Massilia antarctica TaxID=2765360 RepID=A0AA48WJ01_9BURK|nr:DUF2158 domain-containing protein [Massilia antarctica]QPI52911.1 DUF2158 domain-containing protein [Massilia antarctica]
MSNTDHTKITSLIEQRIRDEVQHEGRKAVDAFVAVIEAELAKIGVSIMQVSMYRFVDEVRTEHLNNLVNDRIVALVKQLVQAGQPTAKAEPAAPTFQVGDKVVLKSGGPVMTIKRFGANGQAVCAWASDNFSGSHDFAPHCLVRAGTVQYNCVSS